MSKPMTKYTEKDMNGVLDRLALVISQRDRAMSIASTACRYLNQGGDFIDPEFPGSAGWVTDKEIDDVCRLHRELLSEFNPILIPPTAP